MVINIYNTNFIYIFLCNRMIILLTSVNLSITNASRTEILSSLTDYRIYDNVKI